MVFGDSLHQLCVEFLFRGQIHTLPGFTVENQPYEFHDSHSTTNPQKQIQPDLRGRAKIYKGHALRRWRT